MRRFKKKSYKKRYAKKRRKPSLRKRVGIRM